MFKSIVELEMELEVAISQECGEPESSLWLAKLRRGSGELRSTGDFPVLSVRQSARIENAIANSPGSQLSFYVWLASGCLTTAFVMTQRNAALRRIETSGNESTREHLSSSLRSGESFATVGISHLTTSRRHLSQPPLRAMHTLEGWILEGFSPWVTGALFADQLVVGAVEVEPGNSPDDTQPNKSRELLFAIPTNRLGVVIEPCSELMALNASATGPVRFEQVIVSAEDVLHGPVENVMEVSSRKVANSVNGSEVDNKANGNPKSGAGGLHTSALAIGHAAQAIEYLLKEAQVRGELRPIADGLHQQWQQAIAELRQMDRQEGPLDQVAMRKKANDLALNCTQAALVAAKGVGFAAGHDVGRWCREALFFLVWSCPQSVAQAHLCSFMS